MFNQSPVNKIFLLTIAALSLAACGGRVSAERDAERDRAASQGGGYCDFVSNIDHPDVEVEVGLRLTKRCDMNKSFSITEYRTEKNNNGILFCCAGQNKRSNSNSSSGSHGGTSTITTTTPSSAASPTTTKPSAPTSGNKKTAPSPELDLDQ